MHRTYLSLGRVRSAIAAHGGRFDHEHEDRLRDFCLSRELARHRGDHRTAARGKR